MSHSYNPFSMWDESLSMNEPALLPVAEAAPDFFAEDPSIPVFSQEGELLDLDSLMAGLFTPPSTVVLFDIQD